MKPYLVCIIHGAREEIDSEKTKATKSEIKELIHKASGFPLEDIMVFFDQDLRFQDDEEGIYCEVKWPQGEVPQFEPEKLKADISKIFQEVLGAEKVRIDFKT